jgi:hypothetical protein
MIISHKHKFIFLKTKKTAGTSIEIGLSKFCGPDDIITRISPPDEEIRSSLGYPGPQNIMSAPRFWKASRKIFYNHQPAWHAKKRVGKKIWDSYFKFTIERNPFDKAISRYWWDTRSMDVRPDISTFLASCPAKRLSNWPVYTIADKLAVDYVVRYEAMEEGLSEIGKMLGIGPIELVRAKGVHRSDKSPYQEVLTGSDRKLIEQICSREIETFGYTW